LKVLLQTTQKEVFHLMMIFNRNKNMEFYCTPQCFVGVRYDFENNFFLKAAVGTNIIDYNSKNSADFTIYQITLGSTF